MEKNKIISLSTTLLYSFVLVISFLYFYHSIVESSWLLEIIVSLFVLIGVNLLSYKTKIKEIIFPIVNDFYYWDYLIHFKVFIMAFGNYKLLYSTV